MSAVEPPSDCGHMVILADDGGRGLTCQQCGADLEVVSRDGPTFSDWTFREADRG